MGLFTKVPSVTGSEAVHLVAGGATLVDVRETSEWNAGHAPQAIHAPLSTLADTGRLRGAGPFVLVCASGHRSRSGAKHLRDRGVEAFTLSGGMRSWTAAGGRVVDRKGRPIR
jgi:rhodanese-related sulfurtransferase